MFGCLKRFFKRKPTHYPLLIVGHDERSGGAVVVGHGNEYKYNSKVAFYILNKMPEVRIRFFNELEDDLVKLTHDDFVSLELHCNAYNSFTSGSEVLVLEGDAVSLLYAENLLKALSRKFKKRNRGVKELAKGDRGYNNLKKVKGFGARIAVIVEPFFGDNENDVIPYEDYAEFLINWFKKTSTEEVGV